MAYVLSLISQKGGVGKSTLARLVARQYAAGGYAVKIADLDTKQSTSTHWYTRRSQLGGDRPEIPVQPFAKLSDALHDGARFDLLVLDPGAGDGRIREIANASTYAVIPTTSSTDDLDPTIRLARELVSQRLLRRDQLAIALCRTTGSDAASAAARQIIEGEGFHALAGELPTRPTYENAASEGRTLNETSYPGLNERADLLARSIMDGLEAIAAHDAPPQQGVG